MDLITKNEVANSILTARKETGATFVIVSHDMEFVRKVCDRVVYMKLGKITSMGDADSVLEEINRQGDINQSKELNTMLNKVIYVICIFMYQK